MKRFSLLLALSLPLSALGLACSADRSVEPPTAAAPTPPNESLLGGLTSTVVSVVDWAIPLSSNVTWSFTAGPAGVRSSNAATGLTIVIPPGALAQTVTITVTAVKGNVVNYQFQPAGLQFAYPVTLTQNMSLTSTLLNTLTGTTLKGAYYSSSTLQYDSSTNKATVNEYEPTVTNLLQGSVSWQIKHFSGYVVASCSGGGLLGL
jgi:hypothetical protein